MDYFGWAVLIMTFLILVAIIGKWIRDGEIKRLRKRRDELDLLKEQDKIIAINKKIDKLNGIKQR